jgi:hypothetical protein
MTYRVRWLSIGGVPSGSESERSLPRARSGVKTPWTGAGSVTVKCEVIGGRSQSQRPFYDRMERYLNLVAHGGVVSRRGEQRTECRHESRHDVRGPVAQQTGVVVGRLAPLRAGPAGPTGCRAGDGAMAGLCRATQHR